MPATKDRDQIYISDGLGPPAPTLSLGYGVGEVWRSLAGEHREEGQPGLLSC